jgi:sec-independent protein translocase protein TatC
VLVAVATVVVAFGFALWQNHTLLNVLNRPLTHATAHAARHASGPVGEQARFQAAEQRALRRTAAAFERLSRSATALSPADRLALAQAGAANAAALRAVPPQAGRVPVTLGLAEPFTQTVTVSAYFALLIALPVILYQLYAFVLPAFGPGERRVVLPLMAMVPSLFAAGVAFGYVLVLPAAVGFLQNFNHGQFDALVQARPYYGFVLATLATMGLLFQLPVGILALTRLGVVSARQLRRNRRYAIVGIAVAAMLLPGVDPVTTLIEMVPMLLLYELSVLLASWMSRRDRGKVGNGDATHP